MTQRVLLVDQYNKMGGGQSVLIDLINSLVHLGYDCTVAVPQGGYIESNVTGANFRYLPALKLTNEKKSIFDSLKLLLHYTRILSIVKNVSKADIIYINGPRYFILFYFISFFIRRKFIYHVHLDFSNGGKFILKLLNNHANTYALVFTSEFLLNGFLNYIGSNVMLAAKKLHVIEPGLSKRYEGLSFKNRFTNQQARFNFISVGRIYPGKGFDLIIDIARIYNECQFYIVGNPVDDSLVYYESLKNDAPKNVNFTGSSDNIPQLINDHNIHFGVIPSDLNEAFGIVATELMTCSCITFTRSRGGLIEIATNTGAISFEDKDSLLAAINTVMGMLPESKSALAFTQFSNTKTLYNAPVFTQKLNKLLSV